jgi:bacteriocin biosynthesis cyclodehydratase domain-containing protein
VKRPRLALPFTIVPRGDAVWLVAGEDVRLTLRVERAAEWVPSLLAGCDGARELADVIARVPATFAPAARQLLSDLAGERVLVDGGPEDRPADAAHAFAIAGTGLLADALRARLAPTTNTDAVQIFAQDDLDLGSALAAAARWRAMGARVLWVSLGALARAYVGPLLLADAGPCLECLLGHFRLLSPAPDVYSALLDHAGPFTPAPFPARGVAVAAELACWKLALLGAEPVPSALYALHVVDAASLEITSHRVFRDPECPACAGT